MLLSLLPEMTRPSSSGVNVHGGKRSLSTALRILRSLRVSSSTVCVKLHESAQALEDPTALPSFLALQCEFKRLLKEVKESGPTVLDENSVVRLDAEEAAF